MALADLPADVERSNLRFYCLRFKLVDYGRDDVEKIGLLGGVASRYRCNLVVNAGAANFYLYDVYEEKLEKIVGRLLDDAAEFDFVYYEGIDS